MNKVYIKGVPNRGKEVIAKLEKLGGTNDYGYDGNSDDSVYYIMGDNAIGYADLDSLMGTLIEWIGTEISLDEHPKFKVDDKVKLLTKVGYSEEGNTEGVITRLLQSKVDGINYVMYRVKTDYRVVDLPESCLELISELKKYDPVMVSDTGEYWNPDLYISDNRTLGSITPYGIINMGWKYIIPLADFDFDNLESNIKKSIV